MKGECCRCSVDGDRRDCKLNGIHHDFGDAFFGSGFDTDGSFETRFIEMRGQRNLILDRGHSAGEAERIIKMAHAIEAMP